MPGAHRGSRRIASRLPVATARALVEGFRAVGLDADAIRTAAGVPAQDLAAFDGDLPGEAFGRMWQEAFRRAPREELPTEVGLAVPFGAFGPLDYLAASSATVEAALHSLAGLFRYAATGFSLEVDGVQDGGELRVVRCGAYPGDAVGDEFTLAVIVGRMRARVPGFAVREIALARPPPARPTRHERLLGAPVRFGSATSVLRMPRAAFRAPMPGADPRLQATLRELADRLGLAGSAKGDLEVAVRSRLRALLPEGHAEAPRVARDLGVSARTQHRRLAGAGRTYRGVLESFREAEAERLLAGGVALPEIALRLGFSDQTAWNRAFRRWKRMSPTEWLSLRSSGAPSPAPGSSAGSTGPPPRRRRASRPSSRP